MVDKSGVGDVHKAFMTMEKRYTSEELNDFFIKFKAECGYTGESMESFCQRHGMPYDIFVTWYEASRPQRCYESKTEMEMKVEKWLAHQDAQIRSLRKELEELEELLAGSPIVFVSQRSWN